MRQNTRSKKLAVPVGGRPPGLPQLCPCQFLISPHHCQFLTVPAVFALPPLTLTSLKREFQTASECLHCCLIGHIFHDSAAGNRAKVKQIENINHGNQSTLR